MTTPVTTVAVAVLLAAAAAALAVPAVPVVRAGRGPATLRAPTAPALSGLGAALLCCWVLLDGTSLMLAAILLVAGAVVLRLVLRSRAARTAERRAARVLEACEAMAADLAAGQPPVAVLDRVATDWPELAPAAAAARLDADVPDALRTLAQEAGAAELRNVAAAWQVAHRAGSGLADALDRTADAIRARRRTNRVVAGELAAANATARMMALLPVLVLALGSGLGVDPWGFLVGTPLGLVCLGAGVGLALAGLAWIQHIAAAVTR